MKRSGWLAGLYFLLVFLSGSAVGVFGHRLYTMSSVNAAVETRTSPEEWRRKYIEEITARLSLGQDQLVKLNAILDETRSLHKVLNDRNKVELKAAQRAIVESQRTKIRAILSEVQRPEYEKFIEERESKRREMLKKNPSPPGC